MYGGWLNVVEMLLSLFFAGAAIKLMDDALDVEYDLCRGKRTLAARLGRATLPYSLVLFGIGMTLDSKVALAAFLGSYAVGMFSRPGETLPTHIPAWLEVVATLGICVVLTGWRDALWGVSMMSLIDWLDDVMDRHKDARSGQFNLVIRFGMTEVLFGMLIVFCLALYAQVAWTIAAFVVLVFLNIASELTTVKMFPQEEEEASEPW